ncbi:ADP-ribosylglycohydrolase [Entamoeba marina]
MKQNINQEDAAKEVFKQQFLEYAKNLYNDAKNTYRETDVRLTPKEVEQSFILSTIFLDVVQPLLIPENINSCVKDSTEFLTKDQTEWYYGTERIDYKKMLPDPDWTDDTDQAILILNSIVKNNGKIDVHDFAKRAYFWTAFGFPEIGDIAGLGIRNTFGSTVTVNVFLKDPINSTKSVWFERNKHALNGAVMRTYAVLAAGWEDANELVRNTRTIASVTHADQRCLANLNEFIGFTFKPVGCVVWALRKAVKLLNLGGSRVKIFEVIIMDIVREVGDADTNGVVVGAVLGSYLGSSFLPHKWLQFKNFN